MTYWSPKQQHPKTTTISRRLRNRADQNFSVQPPEIPRLKHFRPRRGATLPTPGHDPFDSRTPESPPLQPSWETGEVAGNFPDRGISHPISIGEYQPADLLLAQTLDFGPYNSPHGSQAELASIVGPHTSQQRRTKQTVPSEFPLSPLPSVSGSHDLEVTLSTDPEQSQNSFIELQDMSTLGFMMAPSQYGMHNYGPPTSYSANYPSASQPGYGEHRSSTSGPYDSSYASSPALTHEQRRPDEPSILPPYQPQQSSFSRSPYQQDAPMSSMRANSVPSASTAQNFSYSAPHSQIPSQPLGSNASSYPQQQLYPANYGVSEYHPLPTMYPPSSTTPAAYPSYDSTHGIAQSPAGNVPALPSSPGGTQNSAVMPRILNSRPKPQCWEHGCNGRQFSTFSNLLRHQREKSGTASKSYCPRCGAEFTRTTARNGHMAHDKCKPRRPSESSH